MPGLENIVKDIRNKYPSCQMTIEFSNYNDPYLILMVRMNAYQDDFSDMLDKIYDKYKDAIRTNNGDIIIMTDFRYPEPETTVVQ